jgi:AbrB family looped-hinge helix DNA binding protein
MGQAAKVTSKGQITIPKDVRTRLGVRPGDELEFIETDGVFTLRKRTTPSRFDRWIGYAKEFKGQDPDKLIEDWRGR